MSVAGEACEPNLNFAAGKMQTNLRRVLPIMQTNLRRVILTTQTNRPRVTPEGQNANESTADCSKLVTVSVRLPRVLRTLAMTSGRERIGGTIRKFHALQSRGGVL